MPRPILALAALLLALPLAVTAQSPTYRPVRDWPQPGAPEYGTAAVSAVAISPRGEVYVFQRSPHPMLVFTRDGKYLRSWGEGMFTNPHGCRFDPDGNLWVTDNADHRVLKLTPEGKVLLTLGVKGVPGEDPTHFNKPADVAFGPKGDLYVADGYGNSRVVHFDKEGRYVGAWGHRGRGEGEFHLPHSVAVDHTGKVYVADRENARVQVFTPDGKFLQQWSETGHPYGLYLTPDQHLFLTDGRANMLSEWDLQGHRLAQWGGTGPEWGHLRLPHLLTVDQDGSVYVAEVDGKRVQKFMRE